LHKFEKKILERHSGVLPQQQTKILFEKDIENYSQMVRAIIIKIMFEKNQ
jgi:hypothetical protein